MFSALSFFSTFKVMMAILPRVVKVICSSMMLRQAFWSLAGPGWGLGWRAYEKILLYVEEIQKQTHSICSELHLDSCEVKVVGA